MTNSTFEALRADLNAKCEGVLLSKGTDYTDGADRLSNFKQLADWLGVPPMVVWAVYFMKHIIAILNLARRGTWESEPPEGRFIDARNYLDLGWAILNEGKRE